MYSWRHITLIAGVLGLDQLSKWWARHHVPFDESITIMDPVLFFQQVHNYGAAYGILQHRQWLLVIISVIVLAVLWFSRRSLGVSKIARIGVCFLTAGTLGNLADRIFYGYVVDFIDIRIFPVLNLADIWINLGVIMLAIDFFRHPHESRNRLAK